jgi:hypothetical protein
MIVAAFWEHRIGNGGEDTAATTASVSALRLPEVWHGEKISEGTICLDRRGQSCAYEPGRDELCRLRNDSRLLRAHD